MDKCIYEYQTYLAFEGSKEIDRVNNMKKFIEGINKLYVNERAKIIPEIPKVLTSDYLNNNYNVSALAPYVIPVGLNYSTVDLVALDLCKIGEFVLLGKNSDDKVNFIKNIMNTLQKQVPFNLTKTLIIDGIERKMRDFEDYGIVERYSIDGSEFEIILEDIAEELDDRYFKVSDDGLEVLQKEPLILVIINNKSVIDNMASNKNAMEIYKKITSKYKTMKICFIFADIENAQIGYSAPEIMKSLKEQKKAFVFENMEEIKMYEIPVNVQRENKKKLEVGDSYMIIGTEITKVKVSTN